MRDVSNLRHWHYRLRASQQRSNTVQLKF